MRRAPTTRDCTARFSQNMCTVRTIPVLRPGVLANIRDQQPSDPIGQAAAYDHGDEREDAFGVERVIREVGLRDGLEIQLLPLRFDTCRFERGEGGCQRLFSELALKG